MTRKMGMSKKDGEAEAVAVRPIHVYDIEMQERQTGGVMRINI